MVLTSKSLFLLSHAPKARLLGEDKEATEKEHYIVQSFLTLIRMFIIVRSKSLKMRNSSKLYEKMLILLTTIKNRK